MFDDILLPKKKADDNLAFWSFESGDFTIDFWVKFESLEEIKKGGYVEVVDE